MPASARSEGVCSEKHVAARLWPGYGPATPVACSVGYKAVSENAVCTLREVLVSVNALPGGLWIPA